MKTFTINIFSVKYFTFENILLRNKRSVNLSKFFSNHTFSIYEFIFPISNKIPLSLSLKSHTMWVLEFGIFLNIPIFSWETKKVLVRSQTKQEKKNQRGTKGAVSLLSAMPQCKFYANPKRRRRHQMGTDTSEIKLEQQNFKTIAIFFSFWFETQINHQYIYKSRDLMHECMKSCHVAL